MKRNRVVRFSRPCPSSTAAATADDQSILEEDSLCPSTADSTASPPSSLDVEIEGLELLDIQDNDEDDDDSASYESEDSLVLARERLPKIWLGFRKRKQRRRTMLEPQDSLELTRKRIPHCVIAQSKQRHATPGREHRRRGGRRPTRTHFPLGARGEEPEEIPDLESIDLSSTSSEDDDKDRCSLGETTVDSLELDRKRFARMRLRRTNSGKPRKHGKDLLFLSHPNRVGSYKTRVRPVVLPKTMAPRSFNRLGLRSGAARFPPMRHRSDGKKGGGGQPQRMIGGGSPLVRHNSTGGVARSA